MSRFARFALAVLFLLTGFSRSAIAESDQPDAVLARANRLSSLLSPEATPFHLKLSISEPANPASPYVAEMEEYWKSPSDWARSIESPQFHQRIIVQGGKRTESNNGDYLPLWLRNFVTAAIDPLADTEFWKKVSARVVLSGTGGGLSSSTCARAQFKIGTPDVNNDAFAVICFSTGGTVSSVVRPGYDMEFLDVQPFASKRIAHRLVDSPESGTQIVARVELLEMLDPTKPIPDLPALPQQTPGSVQSVSISQQTFDKLLESPLTLDWPPVHSGNTQGKLSVYISADRDGQIREAWPLNSDNAGLEDSVRAQLLKVRLHPAVLDGSRVQIETSLTFQFSTHLDAAADPASSSTVASASAPRAPKVRIAPSIANALRVKAYAPVYPQDLKIKRLGGKVVLNAVIGTQGQVVSLTPISSPHEELTAAAVAAVKQWTYRPYLLVGRPVEVETEITVIFDAP